MAEEIGGKLVDMEYIIIQNFTFSSKLHDLALNFSEILFFYENRWIQVHPTGLVQPKQPDAKVKFLAAEALRGVGGVLIDKHGNRFANELGRRDYVTGRMWKNDGPFRLCLNSQACKEIVWHIKHYVGRGLMKEYKTMEDLCKETGTVQLDILKKTFEEHNEIDKKMSDPSTPEGPYDAYGGGKTYDKWGKKFFRK